MEEDPLEFMEPNVIPKNKAKKMVPSISPSANALKGLIGIILFRISNIDVEDVSLFVSNASILSMVVAPIQVELYWQGKVQLK